MMLIGFLAMEAVESEATSHLRACLVQADFNAFDQVDAKGVPDTRRTCLPCLSHSSQLT